MTELNKKVFLTNTYKRKMNSKNMKYFNSLSSMHKYLLIGLSIIMGEVAIAQNSLQLSSQNIDEVVQAMNLEEKATLCCGVGTFFRDTGKGIAGATGGVAGMDRFGFPQTYLADGPSGLRIKETRKGSTLKFPITAFPSPILMACSWDIEAAQTMGRCIGNECKEYNVAAILAPAMNILRFPLCGRTAEYLTEDPVLNGRIAAAYITGVQSQGVGTSIKHFVANNQETARKINDAKISMRTLREIYLKGFEIAVKTSSPWTVMSAYNKINGVYASENKWLLEDVLRREWGFKGIVMSDWDAGMDGAKQIEAGNDIVEPGYAIQRDAIISAVKNGSMKEEVLNRNVKRILQYIVKTPAFNHYTFSNAPDLQTHHTVARLVASEGMVLLKNNAALPMSAGSKIALYGNAAYSLNNREVGLQHGLSVASFKVNKTLANTYKQYLGIDTTAQEVQLTEGGMIYTMFKATPDIQELKFENNDLKAQSRSNDYAVIVLGKGAGESKDCGSIDFELTQGEKELLSKVCTAYHTVGKKVIVVLDIAIPIETSTWKELPDAILCAWQGGQEKGFAIADILGGKISPSGKLTVSFPAKLKDSPAYDNFPLDENYDWNWAQHGFLGKKRLPENDKPVKNIHYTNYAEGIYVGYRYFDTNHIAVSYPFGYGLSYTSFKYEHATIVPSTEEFIATVTIRNTGKYAGREVVQLYISAPQGKLVKPQKELKAFTKTKLLQPGEDETVTMRLPIYMLSSFDEQSQHWIADKGTYHAYFTASAKDIRQTVNFKLKRTFDEDLYSDKLNF